MVEHVMEGGSFPRQYAQDKHRERRRRERLLAALFRHLVYVGHKARNIVQSAQRTARFHDAQRLQHALAVDHLLRRRDANYERDEIT